MSDWIKHDGLFYKINRSERWLPKQNAKLIAEIGLGKARGKNVIDIGAHSGTWTMPLAKCGANVVAVEASFVTFGRLVDGLIKNSLLKTVLPICAAVAVVAGEIAEVRGSGYGDGTSGLWQPERQGRLGMTATVTLDSLAALVLPSQIDLLKIDIEGGEHYILPSVPLSLWRMVDWLALEIHDIQDRPIWHKSGGRNVDLPSLLDLRGFDRKEVSLWRRR